MTESRSIVVEVIPSKRPWRGQRWFVRGTWRSNGNIAFHSELYRNKSDARHLAETVAQPGAVINMSPDL